MFGSLMLYAGFALELIGFVSMFRPLRFMCIRTRRHAVRAMGAGLLLLAAGFLLPAPESYVQASATRLDEFAPAYQFNEVHVTRIMAPPDRVYESVKAVTAEEIRLFRTLTWIRRLGRPGPEGILQSPEKQPLLDVATRTSFLLLAQQPGREIVIGTIVIAPPGTRYASTPGPAAYKELTRPGFAKATMNFLIQPDGNAGCLLRTETRVFATDASSKRRFSAYWRVIYPGSALIRIMWLRAIKQRAELAKVP